MAVVNVVVADPKQGGTGYAGTASGRVHKTTDEGKTWAQVLLCDAEVTALWIDAQFNHKDTPDTAIILVGTGNGKLYRSGDSGAIFVQKTAFPGTGPIKYLISDPRNPLRWYVLSGSALYLTDNNGASFTILYDFGSATAEDAAWSYWTEFLVALSGSLGGNTPAMHSSNDGKTFATGLGLAGVAGLSAISMSPFEKTEALALEKNSNHTWKVSAASGDTYTWSRAADLEGNGQCLRVDGDMHAVVFAGTNQKLMKSVDFGGKFYVVKDNVDVRYISLGPLKKTSPTRLYFWVVTSGGVQRFRVSDDNSLSSNGAVNLGYSVTAIKSYLWNPNICYAVTQESASGGILRLHKTTDGGASWNMVWSKTGTGNLVVKPQSLFVSHSNPSRVMFATQGDLGNSNDGFYLSTDGGATCNKISMGRSGVIRSTAWYPDEGVHGVFEDKNGAIWTFHDPIVISWPGASHWSKSTDGGLTWMDIPGGNAWESTRYDQASADMSEDGLSLLGIKFISGGGNQHFWTSNGGQTWGYNELSGEIPQGNTVAISNLNPLYWARCYTGFGQKITYTTSANPNAWQWTADSGVYFQTGVWWDYYDLNTLYVMGNGGSRYIAKSTNLGASWVGMTGAVPVYASSISYGRM